jgi:hypothetical protein
MAIKNKFAYVAKKTLFRLKTFGRFNTHSIYRFWAEKKIKKIFERSKNKNGRSTQDGRQNLIFF